MITSQAKELMVSSNRPSNALSLKCLRQQPHYHREILPFVIGWQNHRIFIWGEVEHYTDKETNPSLIQETAYQ